MKLINILVFFSPFVAAAIMTYFTWARLLTLPLAYGLWLTMIVPFFMFVNFAEISLSSHKYNALIVGSPMKLRIAAFITSFNENPEIVEKTLIAVKNALGDMGEVFLLDDSTDKQIVKELIDFCSRNGIRYFHRNDRKGYKAGAINDALKRIEGEGFDLVAIFDADQRPTKDFFKQVLPYFEDPKIAFVQIPQRYTELYSSIAQGAKYQQEPFLRVIMKGRHSRSAFSLGSGTVFRISALKEVGYLPETSITEDAAVSIKLHSKGYKSAYADVPLIWYGIPPQDVNAYITQQSRWAFGYFSLIRSILTSNLSVAQFIDYYAGFLYWTMVGPLTIIEVASPAFFLITRIPIIIINPILYIIVYLPYFLFSIFLFILIMSSTEYGIKGFYYHKTLEYLEFAAITTAFISWLLRKKRPFKVTPKGSKAKASLKLVLPHIAILATLVIAFIEGLWWLFTSSKVSEMLYYAIIVNLFWDAFFIPFFFNGIRLALQGSSTEGGYTYLGANTNLAENNKYS